MLKNKVLVPRDLAEECTLLEALYYMAFDVYPLYLVQTSEIDIRRDPEADRQGEFGIFCDEPVEFILDNERCRKFELPENPHYLELNDESLFSYFCSEIVLDQRRRLGKVIHENDPIGFQKLERDSEQEAVKMLDHKRKIELWDQAVNIKLKSYSGKLLQQLQNDRIKASGKMLAKSLKNRRADDELIDEENWNLLPEKDEFIAIPCQIWNDSKIEIDWESSRCAGLKEGYYTDILLSVEDLIKFFPKKTSGTSLNSIIKDVVNSLYSASGTKPTAHEVWKEIKKNKDTYSGVIVSMTNLYEISWRVTNTGEEKNMSKKTFQNLVSKFK